MPKALNQNMFPVEQCKRCGTDGVLYLTLRDRYMWRCGTCLGTWRTPGSELAFWNALRGSINYDKPAGLIVEEQK